MLRQAKLCQLRIQQVEKRSRMAAAVRLVVVFSAPARRAAIRRLAAAKRVAAVARVAAAKRAAVVARASTTLLVGPKCNSQELRAILEHAIIAHEANESKRLVHASATEAFSDEEGNPERTINVFCAPRRAQLSHCNGSLLRANKRRHQLLCLLELSSSIFACNCLYS